MLDGSLGIIIRGNISEIIQKLSELFLEISRNLHIGVHILTDSNGRPLVRKWRADAGIGEFINLPDYFDSNFIYEKNARIKRFLTEGNFYKYFYTNIFKFILTLNSFLIILEEENFNEGIYIKLKFDVSECFLKHNATEASAFCFSNIKSILNWLAIGSATNVSLSETL